MDFWVTKKSEKMLIEYRISSSSWLKKTCIKISISKEHSNSLYFLIYWTRSHNIKLYYNLVSKIYYIFKVDTQYVTILLGLYLIYVSRKIFVNDPSYIPFFYHSFLI